MSADTESSGDSGKAWIGYIVAAACLVWVFHDVRWSDLFARVKTMNYWLLAPAIAADVASYTAQGARWSLLLRPLARLSTLQAAQAIYAGLFTNEVMPLRVGEILRAYLASRWTSLSITRIVSSILVERFLDGVWMVLTVGVVVLAVPLPRYLVDAEEMLAAAIFAAAALFIFLVLRRERSIEEGGPRPEAAPLPGLGNLPRWIDHVAEALRSIGRARTFYGAAAVSGLLLALQVLSFWLVMEAYHLSFSVWHGAVVFLIVHLGTLVPGAPSNVGTYQFFTVLGLTLFGVDKTTATGFSVIAFLILTIPLWIIGLIALGRAGLDLRTVRQEAASLTKRWRSSPGAIRAIPAPDGGAGGENNSVGN